MSIEEVIKAIDNLKHEGNLVSLYAVKEIISKIKQEKPVIPQFVADWIEKCKEKDRYTLGEALSPDVCPLDIDRWFYLDAWEKENLFAQAWLFGYEIEQEQLYTVEIPNVYHNSLGYYHLYNNLSFYNKEDDKDVRFELTEAEIKSVDERLWQFAKEVED